MSSLMIHRIEKINFRKLHLLENTDTWSLTLDIYQEKEIHFDIVLFSKNKKILQNLLNSN